MKLSCKILDLVNTFYVVHKRIPIYLSVRTGFVCLYEKGVKNVCPFLPVAEKEEYKKGHVFADKNSQKKSEKLLFIKICRKQTFFLSFFKKKIYISRGFQSLLNSHICLAQIHYPFESSAGRDQMAFEEAT